MKIFYKDEAVKHLKEIGAKDLPKVKRKIEAVIANPLMGKNLKGEHEGQLSIRAWPLRVVYTFDPKSQTIEIITIDYRGQVYK